MLGVTDSPREAVIAHVALACDAVSTGRESRELRFDGGAFRQVRCPEGGPTQATPGLHRLLRFGRPRGPHP